MAHEMSQTRHQPNSAAALPAGFAQPVFDGQAVFRAAMTALSRPALIHPFDVFALKPPAPLSPEAAALLLALADFETPISFDPGLAANPAVAAFVTFHTGAAITADPASARFAVIADAAACPPLTRFALGTPEYPDRSTMLIIQTSRLMASGPVYDGPGFAAPSALAFEPAPEGFSDQWRANRALFPRGVDVIAVASGVIAGLPRSARLVEPPSRPPTHFSRPNAVATRRSPRSQPIRSASSSRSRSTA
jgi:alpha-D-ribose 1-methylphosphonate 5-triphosphate synthase subunit PhnH